MQQGAAFVMLRARHVARLASADLLATLALPSGQSLCESHLAR